jgi:hypothetical protein
MTEPTKDLIPVQSKELVQNALDFCSSVTSVVITTEDEYLNNCELTKKVTKYDKDVDKELKALLKPINDERDEIKSYFKNVQIPLKNLREKLRLSLADYTAEKERKRIAAQKKAEVEAEKERQRLEAQAKKDAEKSQAAAENGDTTKAEEYHLRSKVRQDMAESVEPAVIPKETPKVAGISYRTDWSARVTDKKKFVEYCAQHGKLEYLDINMKLLNAFAKSFKDTIELPGIEIISTKVQVTR